jgi:hypothetical protein
MVRGAGAKGMDTRSSSGKEAMVKDKIEGCGSCDAKVYIRVVFSLCGFDTSPETSKSSTIRATSHLIDVP